MEKEKDKECLEKLKEEYEKVRKKYSLPAFDEIDSEFEIRKIDFDLHLVKEIRRLVTHKFSGIADLFEPILNPGQSVHSAVESKIFEKEDVEEMFKFYKKLWYHIHKSIAVSFVSEKEEAEFIKEMWKLWPEIKKTAQKYAQKIAEGWAKEEKERAGDHYLS